MMELFEQAGAIPYRILHDAIEVLLISTSRGKNLTIPKGLIDPGNSATETAVNEAYEEAGADASHRHLWFREMGREMSG